MKILPVWFERPLEKILQNVERMTKKSEKPSIPSITIRKTQILEKCPERLWKPCHTSVTTPSTGNGAETWGKGEKTQFWSCWSCNHSNAQFWPLEASNLLSAISSQTLEYSFLHAFWTTDSSYRNVARTPFRNRFQTFAWVQNGVNSACAWKFSGVQTTRDNGWKKMH